MKFRLYHKNQILFTGTEEECYNKLGSIQPFTPEIAEKIGSYAIVQFDDGICDFCKKEKEPIYESVDGMNQEIVGYKECECRQIHHE
jgi:hypothetical protein